MYSLFFASRGHILHLEKEIKTAAVKCNTNLSLMMVHTICEAGYAIHRSHSEKQGAKHTAYLIVAFYPLAHIPICTYNK